MSRPTDGLYIPDGYRTPREWEEPDVWVCQCHRRVLVPTGKDRHKCVWVPLVFADDNPLKGS